MECTNRKCLIIMSIGLCTLTYQGYELILSFISTMESIWKFCFIIFSAVILIALRNVRNRENNYTQESTSAKQNPVIKQNRVTGGKVTRKPKVPTAAVNGTKRSTRLQKEFPSTAPGKIRLRGKSGPKTAVSEAVRENIELIENDLKVKESSLLDEMQGYLSEEDVFKITQSSRKDQAHFFAEIIEDLNGNSFLHVLNILNKTSFGHISKELKKSYEKYLPTQLPSTLCPICRIQSEVDIKSLRCGLIKEGLLPKDLKKDINNCQALKGHQNVLWQELFYHLKMMQPKQEISEKFINIFKVAKHRGIFSYLSLHGLPCYDCTCETEKPSIKADILKTTSTLNLNGSDESTTSSIEVAQDPQWYNDAVHSTSSEEGVKPVTMKSRKRLDRSSHSPRKKKNAKAETKTENKPLSLPFPPYTENSDSSTIHLRFDTVQEWDITSFRHHASQKHRAVKRVMNPTTENGDLLTIRGPRKSSSEPALKLPYKADESLQKRLKIISVRPFSM